MILVRFILRAWWIGVVFSLFTSSLIAQVLESSNLPIVSINTYGQIIKDDPKVDAEISVYYQSDGSRNFISDAPQLNHAIGIELRGQTSQMFDKKGFGFEFRDDQGEDLDTNLVDMPKESDWVIHSPYSDKSLMRNALTYILAARSMDYAPRVRFAELVINDEYQGVVLLTEKIKRGKDRVDVSKLKKEDIADDQLTGGYIVKIDKGDAWKLAWKSPFKPILSQDQRIEYFYHYPKFENIQQEQASYIESKITGFEYALQSANFLSDQIGYRTHIDVESFIDFMLINEMSKNIDAYRLSTYLYKDKDSKNGAIKMGPVWDYNLAYGNCFYCEAPLTSGWAYEFNDRCADDYWLIPFWWDRFLEDPLFNLQLKERYSELRSSQFSDTQICNVVDSLRGILIEAQARNFEQYPILGEWVWPNEFVGQSYNSEVTHLKNWLIDRLHWMDENLKQISSSYDTKITELDVFPNPSSGIIHSNQFGQFDYFDLFNISGDKLMRLKLKKDQEFIELDTGIDNGIYFYQFSDQLNRRRTGRLVIQRK